MRQFAGSGFRIWKLSREAKVIYTFFCALSLLAVASSVALYEDLVGPSLRSGHVERVKRYYTAEPAPPAPEAAPAPAPTSAEAPGGPQIALAEEERAPSITVAVPLRKLIEVTHFHLFTVPVFLLILTHLFMLTGVSARQKLVWITLGWGAGTLHIAAPWLIRWGGAGLAGLFPISGALFAVASLVLTVYPVVVMWRRPRRKNKRPHTDGSGHPHGPGGHAEPRPPAHPEGHDEDEHAPPLPD